MADPETTRRAVEAFFSAVGTAGRDDFVALFGPEVHFEDPLGTPVNQGPEGVARFHKGLRRAWQSLTMTPTAIHVRGDEAAAAWQAEGLSATGKTIRFAGVDTFRVGPDGRINRVHGYWDFEGVIGQM